MKALLALPLIEVCGDLLGRDLHLLDHTRNGVRLGVAMLRELPDTLGKHWASTRSDPADHIAHVNNTR